MSHLNLPHPPHPGENNHHQESPKLTPQGFQYVIEALVGGNFASQINPGFLISPYAPPSAVTDIAARLQKAQDKLQARRPILVCHNALLDLCFLKTHFLSAINSTRTDSGLP